MSPSSLSVIVITLDEEANLARCLESVRFADEVVVVDAGSTDRTVAIAREYTHRVFERPMQGFGAQKQFALAQATGDWVLSLDADEWVSDELRAALRRFLGSPAATGAVNGYRILLRNVYLGRPMRHCGWRRPLLRLFRRRHGRFTDTLVHERVVVDGACGHLEGEIIHVPYRDVFHHAAKISRYARLDAVELRRRGRLVSGWRAPIHLVLRPLWKFVEKLAWQGGVLDGLHGLVLSAMAAYSVFLIHARCWELERADRTGDG